MRVEIGRLHILLCSTPAGLWSALGLAGPARVGRAALASSVVIPDKRPCRSKRQPLIEGNWVRFCWEIGGWQNQMPRGALFQIEHY